MLLLLSKKENASIKAVTFSEACLLELLVCRANRAARFRRWTTYANNDRFQDAEHTEEMEAWRASAEVYLHTAS